ncbi:sortase [Nocardioides dubius]|uniref:Big-1 domain-containing protein n=1 Tax=Nocardioides dubius TaxID=317019 RepID=A0ABN1TPB5_9ACTN
MRFVRLHARDLAVALVVLLLVGGLPLLMIPATASVPIGTVTASACRADNPNLRTGICFRFPDGRVTWLGTLASSSGRVFFCIDKSKDSRLPAQAPRRSTAGLRNQFGRAIGRREVAALNYVVSTWGAGANTITAAAISLIVRQVMSDARGQFPGGLTVGEQVRDLAGGLPAPVLDRARAMWREASVLRGPWRLRVQGSVADLESGARRRLTATVRSAAGHRVPGARVRLSYNDQVRGPAARTTSARGVARFTVTARGSGTLVVRAAVTGPSGNGVLFVPRDGRIQRGWIAERSRDSVKVRGMRVRVLLPPPVVRTRSSAEQVRPGQSFHDVVEVAGLPRAARTTLEARLYGPYPTQPTIADCRPEELVAVHRLQITGSGVYALGETAPSAPGHYVWVASLAETALTAAVTHPCGLVPETTLVVRSRPRLRTQVSQQIAVTGARLRDTIWVQGLWPGERVRVRWELLAAPAVRGRCGPVSWARAIRTGRARVFDRGALWAVGDGKVVTRPSKKVRTPRCYTYTERIASSASTEGAWHRPGLVPQTTLVRKPGRPGIPTGPQGWVRTSPAARIVGSRLVIPRLGGQAIRVRPIVQRGGSLALPGDPWVLGWWRGSAPLRAVRGGSIVAGHVADRSGAPGALHRLATLRRGDRIVWRRAGVRRTFRVVRTSRTPRTGELPARIWRLSGPRMLHLITCTRKVVYPSGYYHYTHNLTVTAWLRPLR